MAEAVGGSEDEPLQQLNNQPTGKRKEMGHQDVRFDQPGGGCPFPWQTKENSLL